jgi:hypothetical protein
VSILWTFSFHPLSLRHPQTHCVPSHTRQRPEGLWFLLKRENGAGTDVFRSWRGVGKGGGDVSPGSSGGEGRVRRRWREGRPNRSPGRARGKPGGRIRVRPRRLERPCADEESHETTGLAGGGSRVPDPCRVQRRESGGWDGAGRRHSGSRERQVFGASLAGSTSRWESGSDSSSWPGPGRLPWTRSTPCTWWAGSPWR